MHKSSAERATANVQVRCLGVGMKAGAPNEGWRGTEEVEALDLRGTSGCKVRDQSAVGEKSVIVARHIITCLSMLQYMPDIFL